VMGRFVASLTSVAMACVIATNSFLLSFPTRDARPVPRRHL
jgi:hypothetical protein